jgi:O-6-methylguanine DNA methyltransferase
MKKLRSRASETALNVTPQNDDRVLDELIARARARIGRALKSLKRPEGRVGIIDSPVGQLLVAEGPRGLAALHFLAVADADRTLDALRRRFDLIENSVWRRGAEGELRRYFAGDFSVLRHRVDLCLVESDFQRRALEALRRVPAGSVISYRGLAAAVGEPESQRAIGNTMASNPVPIFVPCHRVIKSDGSVGNYGGGVERKLLLLKLEGFRIGGDLRMPSGAVLGHRHTHIFCRPECSAARRARPANALVFADAGHARSAGMRACRLCKPE